MQTSGPGGPAGGPRLPPPGMMPYSEHLPPFPPGMPGMPTDKPIGAVPPQMMQVSLNNLAKLHPLSVKEVQPG